MYFLFIATLKNCAEKRLSVHTTDVLISKEIYTDENYSTLKQNNCLKSTGCFYAMTVHYKPNSFSLIRPTVPLRKRPS